MGKIENIFRWVVLCFVSLFLFTFDLHNQNYGITLGLEYLRSEGDFRQFSSVPDAIPYYGSGTSFAPNLGAFYNIKVAKNLFLQSQIGIKYFPFKITAERDFSLLFDSTKVINDFLLHKKFTLEQNQLNPFFSLCLVLSTIQYFSFNAGFSLAFHSSSPNEILFSETKYFKDSIPRFRTSTGNLPSGGRHKFPVSFSFVTGITYEPPFLSFGSIKLGISPYFSFGFSNLTNEFTSDIVAFGIRVNVFPRKLTEKIKPAEPPLPKIIDTLPVPQNLPPVEELETQPSPPQPESKNFIYVIPIYNGNYRVSPKVYLIRKNYENHVPLLNYVFFDYGSSRLDKRYVQLENQSDFNPDSLNYNNPLEVYWNILNIIGYRLQQNPKAKIRLVGCNSNIGEEYNNLELSKLRAENISKYLVRVWNIDPSRISIELRNLPQNFSNPNIPEGNQENQRVEILSDSPEILSPVTINEINSIFFPDTIRLKVTMKSETRRYRLDFFDTTFFGYNSVPSGKVDSFDVSLNKFFKDKNLDIAESFDDWICKEFRKKNPKRKEIYIYVEFFVDSTRESEVLCTSLPLFETVRNKALEVVDNEPVVIEFPEPSPKPNQKFSLLLFDFNSSKVNPNQIEFLRKIASKIEGARKITLIGHTDIIGERNYNIELSKARAEEVARILNLNSAQIIGVGSEQIRFDNKLPEGRFYSRTVEIVVEY